jgi:hypothetical protein
MSDDKIELSSSGLKLSYLRFLADGAAGLIIVLLLFVSYYKAWPPEWHMSDVGKEVKIFILIAIILLAIPIGLFLNAVGWFLFGGLQAWGAKLLFAHPCWITKATNSNYSLERISDAYKLDKNNFYERSQLHEDTVRIFHGYLAEDAAHVKGIKRLIRSMVIIVLAALLLFLPKLGLGIAVVYWFFFSLPTAAVLLIILALLEYYERLGALQKAYIISLDESVLTDEGDAILKRLVRGGLPGRSTSQEGAGKKS